MVERRKLNQHKEEPTSKLRVADRAIDKLRVMGTVFLESFHDSHNRSVIIYDSETREITVKRVSETPNK